MKRRKTFIDSNNIFNRLPTFHVFYVDNKQCLTHSTDAGTSIEQYWYKVVIKYI